MHEHTATGLPFVVEGNIGSGKSTLLSLIQKTLSLPILYEPTAAWQQVDGEHNMLQAFYADTKRWAYTFQSYAFVSRVRAQQEYSQAHPKTPHIAERSVWSDRYCFAKNCYESGMMNALEWKLYKEWFVWLMQNYVALPAGFIYLRAEPEVCFARLQKRCREEESAVTLDYLQALHQKHEAWLIDKEQIEDALRDIPVLILDVNQEFVQDAAKQKMLMDKIEQFVIQQSTPTVSCTQHIEHAYRS